MNILDLHHVIIHPLSILIHLQFQDKDGCSRNGSREFLFDSHIIENERDLSIKKRYQLILDHKGVPVRLSGIPVVTNFEHQLLNWKSCLVLRGSLTPFDSFHRQFLEDLIPSLHNSIMYYVMEELLNDPSGGNFGFVGLCGEVVSLWEESMQRSSLLSPEAIISLSCLPSLRSLKLATKSSKVVDAVSLLTNLYHLNIEYEGSLDSLETNINFISNFANLNILHLIFMKQSHNDFQDIFDPGFHN